MSFSTDAVVYWNGYALNTLFQTTGQLTAEVPASLIETVMPVDITVKVNGVSSNVVPFTIIPRAVISGLNPKMATVGGPSFTLTVSGSNFISGAVVSFNGNNLPTTVIDSNTLTVTVPDNLINSTGTFQVVVTQDGSASAPFDFNVTPLHTLTSISPNTKTAGASSFTLTVNGTNFLNSALVGSAGAVINFNGVPLITTFNSSTLLTATVSNAAILSPGLFNVTVTQGNVTSSPQVFTVTAPQTLISISPNTAVAGASSFTLTVTGTNFLNSSVIVFNGSRLNTTFDSSTSLSATVPDSAIEFDGSFPVAVEQGGVTTSPQTFTVTPAPIIDSIDPQNSPVGGDSFTMTVKGMNFISGAVVKWGGLSLPATVIDPTTLTVSITTDKLNNIGQVSITVEQGGVSSNSVSFNVTAAPHIISISPSAKVAGGPTFTLTVNGSYFFLAQQ